MNKKYFFGQQAASCTKYDKSEPVSKIILLYDDENGYEAGDDSGYAMTISCPYATQQMANDLLAKAKGFQFQGFSATGLELPPDAELGSAVTVDGIYGMITERKVKFTPGFTSEVSAPFENEVDHEYEYEGTYKKELKNKVALGATYYGTSITRKEGLVIKRTDGENELARVVLNADELSFYAGSNQVLFFDAVNGTYKFTGEINVNDNFIVDKYGNLTIGGNIVFTGDSSFTTVRYSTNKNASIPDGWVETWNDAWSNTSTEVWAIYSYNAGRTWGSPVLIQGRTGAKGSDANVDFDNILAALQEAHGVERTFITATKAGAPEIFGGKIYGSEIYAGSGSAGYSKMTEVGFDIVDDSNNHKIGLGIKSYQSGSDIVQPYLLLGAGTDSAADLPNDAGCVKKFTTGLWIGSSDALRCSSTNDMQNQATGKGIFISFQSSGTIYTVWNGSFSAVGSGTAVFG